VGGKVVLFEILGLSSPAKLVYTAMLEHPGHGVTELAEHLSLRESVVRAGLDELADLMLLRPSRETQGVFRLVDPQIGLEILLRRQEEDLARRTHKLAVSKAAASKVIAEYTALVPEIQHGSMERLVGLDAVQGKLELLAAQASEECLSVMPGGAQSQASMDSSRPLDADAARRGISLTTLYQDSARNDQATLSYARWLTGLGGQVRTAPVIPPRMLIFDRTTALVPIDPANTRLGALCTREPGIVASLVAIYRQAWDTAVPLGAEQQRNQATGLSAAERELLLLLSTGLTDETAAKRLCVSLRTVRRQMAALMERLGAASRFEAGLKAAQRGWL
jgi:DNA-binding CsgD family transcriptional regulator